MIPRGFLVFSCEVPWTPLIRRMSAPSGMSWASRKTLLDTSMCSVWISSQSDLWSWASQVWRPHLVHIGLLFRCQLSPWSHYYYINRASCREQVKFYKAMFFTVLRGHYLLGSETSILPRPAAPNVVNYHFHQVTKTCCSANLQIHDVGCHELLGEISLIPLYCKNLITVWVVDPKKVEFEAPIWYT